MKNIKKLLREGELSAKECILSIIKNDIHRRNTGKSLLTEAEIEALSSNESVRTYKDVEEYNKYIFLWKVFQYFEIDMQNYFNKMQIDIANFEKTLMFYYYREDLGKIKSAIESLFKENEKEASLAYILENTGFEYENLVHRMTFLSISESLRKDILLLDELSGHDCSYLEQEEQLSEILLSNEKDAKSKLNTDDVIKLVNLIINSMPWDREEFMKKRKLDFTSLIFGHFFGGYQILNFGKELADDNNIAFKDENDLKKKLSKVVGLRKKLRKTIKKSIENGLFFKQYIPLCTSTEKNTYTDNTNLKHKDILKLWIKEKRKNKKILQKMIDEKELVLEEKETKIFELKIKKKIITGKSLYYSLKDFDFINEYREQADSLIVYGYLFNCLEKENILKKYGNILAYRDIVSEMSKVIETKASKNDELYLGEMKVIIESLNIYLNAIDDQINEYIFNGNFNFQMEAFFEDFIINLKKARAVKVEVHRLLLKEIKTSFRS